MYSLEGVVERQFLVKDEEGGDPRWVSQEEAQRLLDSRLSREKQAMWMARAPARIGRDVSSWSELTDEEKVLLMLTCKEWSARHRSGTNSQPRQPFRAGAGFDVEAEGSHSEIETPEVSEEFETSCQGLKRPWQEPPEERFGKGGSPKRQRLTSQEDAWDIEDLIDLRSSEEEESPG